VWTNDPTKVIKSTLEQRKEVSYGDWHNSLQYQFDDICCDRIENGIWKVKSKETGDGYYLFEDEALQLSWPYIYRTKAAARRAFRDYLASLFAIDSGFVID
jgi:hypothetical protein